MSGPFEWDVSPYLLSFGSTHILRWYGVLFVSGFIIGFHLLKRIYEREGYNPDDLNILLWYIIAGTIIGARLVHCLFYQPEVYLRDPIRILKFWEGGLASHGGGLGVIIAIYIYQRKRAEGFMWILDRISIVTALAGSFIRLGNFFNSEIIGTKTTVPWAVIFKRVDYFPRHPAQLYESFSYLLIFAILYLLYYKTRLRERRGGLLGLFLILVFSARLVVEEFKQRQASFAIHWDLSVGQWLSIPFILLGIGLTAYALLSRRHTPS